MNSFVTSLIRTYVPIAVGAVVSLLLAKGIELDPSTQAGLIVALTGVSQAVYYFLARVLERKFPQFSFLLGSSAQPRYVEPKK